MMAQEIVTFCDQHLADGEHVTGATYTVTIAGPGITGKAYETDACPAHAGMLAELAGWLTEHGRPVTRNGSTPDAPATCPTCGFVSANRKALSAHVRIQHSTSLTALEGKAQDRKCPECGETFSSPQGLGAHRFRSHGVAGTSGDSKAGKAAKTAASGRRRRGEVD